MIPLFALLLSCAKEQHPRVLPDVYSKSDVEVKAVPSIPDGWTPMTKAPSDIPNIDNTALQSSGFGVYAFYTGEEEYSADKDKSAYAKYGLVLNNRRFEYNAGTWTNSGTAEFWPTASGENLSLFAYAPWEPWNTDNNVSYDGKVPSIKYDDYVAQDLSVSELEKQKDLLWGTNTSGNPHRNVEKDDYDPEGTVDFHFRHATAKVKFSVSGSLPGESRTLTSMGDVSTSTGSAGTAVNGEVTSKTNSSFTTGDYNSGGWGSNTRYYYATETQTETESYTQAQYRTNTETVTGAVYSVQGQRYLVEEVTFKGFNQKGTLVLNNETAYYPTWTDVSAFTGSDPEYVLNASNVLTDSLQYVSAATVQSAFETYLGIRENPTDLMSGYFLYAIPRESTSGNRIAVTIKYHKLNVEGTLTVNQGREVVQVRTRTVTRTRTRTRNSETIAVSITGGGWGGTYNYPSDASSYTFSADYGSWSSWSSWSNPSWSGWSDYSYGDYNITNSTLTGATVNYDNDTSPELSGEIITSLLGGRAYNINLIISGDKIDLDVVPQPWELDDFEFDYNANMNEVTQALTYDSSYIDWADASGHVYINNRLGKFYFRLGAGKYSSWQASLVPTGGSSPGAFGFTDENGNWLLEDDGVTKVSYIRGSINPSVTNFIYVKAVDTEATVTSSAILRIYFIDAAGDATVALNLVNQRNVNEWTIVQNAN